MRPIRPTLQAAAITAACWLSACGNGDGDAQAAGDLFPAPPAGAVLALGPGEFLSEPFYVMDTEIDRWVDTIAAFEPEEVLRSWRRKAMTNIVLPRAVGAAIYPEDRLIAKESIMSLRELALASRDLPADGPQLERLHGHGLEIGISAWGTACELEQGVWSDVFEVVGGFQMLRRVSEVPPGGFNAGTQVSIERIEVRYIPMEATMEVIEDARKKLGVTPLNPPGWDGVLPELYVYE